MAPESLLSQFSMNPESSDLAVFGFRYAARERLPAMSAVRGKGIFSCIPATEYPLATLIQRFTAAVSHHPLQKASDLLDPDH